MTQLRISRVKTVLKHVMTVITHNERVIVIRPGDHNTIKYNNTNNITTV